MLTADIRNIIRDGVRPQRAGQSLTVEDSAMGGLTVFHKRKVDRIAAPLRAGAYARTIRIHELLHANHTPTSHSRKYPELAQNAIEDARVHSVYWPQSMPERANRDCIATALRDMRTIPPMVALARAEDWNRNLLIALRAAAILGRLGNHKQRTKLQARMVSAFGPLVSEKLIEILGKVRSRKGQAQAEFTALMRDDERHNGNERGSGSHGLATAQPMRIVRLPMPELCNAVARRTALARGGARLNRARLAKAVATGSTVGLFLRQRYLPGGTYLIDASGSMSLSSCQLNNLCRSAPAATVAYYSGWGHPERDGVYGELVIYAEHSKRAVECDRIWGGNEVDYYAIQWLLKQPAPRVYIGDGEFCGGPEGQDSAAATLLAAAVANGQLRWLKSVSELG